MTPFTFSDGTYVPTNNWLTVPQQALMKDPANYDNPEVFNGFRFVKENEEMAESESRLSHPSWRFPFWGSVKQAWLVPVPSVSFTMRRPRNRWFVRGKYIDCVLSTVRQDSTLRT